MMKKISYLMVVLAVAATMVSCGWGSAKEAQADSTQVVLVDSVAVDTVIVAQ